MTTKKKDYTTATHNVFVRIDEKDVHPNFGPWLKIGLAWADGNGEGFELRLHNPIPVDGKINLVPIKDKPDVWVA